MRRYFYWLVFGVTIFVAFFVLSKVSLAEGLAYDKAKAIEIVKSQGGPGNCKSEAECSAFCNEPNNTEACLIWAKSNGIIKGGDVDKNIELVKTGGPGGCKTAETCRAYCDDPARGNECTDFAEKQGFISKEQAQRAKKVGPGGCRTQKDCQAFCEQPQNQDTCLNYAVQEGLMSQDEAAKIRDFKKTAEEFRQKTEEFAKQQSKEFKPPEVKNIDPGFDEQKAKQIIGTQGGPGGCKTFDECRAFCDKPDNQKSCFSFAEEHGLFKHQEEANKIKGVLENGGPGGCRGEKACRDFCQNPDNMEVCLEFGQKQGFLSSQEIEKAKKGIEAFKEGGPGGCKTKDTCDKVCQGPANQEACFEWAKKHGLISEEQLKFIEESKKLREKFDKKREESEGELNQPQGEFTAIPHPTYTGYPSYTPYPYPSYSSGPDPATECVKHGGSWVSGKCIFPSGVSSPTPYPSYSGSPYPSYSTSPYPSQTPYPSPYLSSSPPIYSPTPYPSYSQTPYPSYSATPYPSQTPYPSTDPAAGCVKYGGTWNGTTCVMPSPKPVSFLGKILSLIFFF